MDGTIIDSMPVHRSNWAEFAARHGLLGRPDELERASGRTGIEGMHARCSAPSCRWPWRRPMHEKESLYREQFGAAFRWVAGFERFALQAMGRGLRLLAWARRATGTT